MPSRNLQRLCTGMSPIRWMFNNDSQCCCLVGVTAVDAKTSFNIRTDTGSDICKHPAIFFDLFAR